MIPILALTVAFLAYANGANDNFKGVASLYGSRTCGYRTAITWATVTTAAGSIAAVFLASVLLKNFSGKGLVPDHLVLSPAFALAVAFGAGGTVLSATRLGFPISTTHGLVGAIVGAGMSAAAGGVHYTLLGKNFLLPLLLSPMLAVVSGGLIYLLLRGLRKSSGIREETCVCVGGKWQPVMDQGVSCHGCGNPNARSGHDSGMRAALPRHVSRDRGEGSDGHASLPQRRGGQLRPRTQ